MNGSFYDSSFQDKLLNDNLNNQKNNVNDFFLVNLLLNNIGKKINIHIVLPTEERVVSGIIEEIGNDYLATSNPSDSEWQLIMFAYISYITFLEPINLL